MERQYFYLLDNEQCGPFVLADLRDVNLPPEILVWYEGMAEWQPAATLPELQDLYQVPPPQAPIPNQPSVKKRAKNPTLKFFRIVLAILFLIFAVALVGSGLENNPIEITPFIMGVIFLGLGIWLLLKKSQYITTGPQNQNDYTDADGAIYAQEQNMLQQDDYLDNGDDFD